MKSSRKDIVEICVVLHLLYKILNCKFITTRKWIIIHIFLYILVKIDIYGHQQQNSNTIITYERVTESQYSQTA